MLYDMTSYDSNLKSLIEFLDLNEEEILDFIFLESTEVIEFLEAFEIEDEKLFEKEIELVSLHSTSSIDNCNCIKSKGIINLQEAITIDTPLKKYLETKDIHINIEGKYILYKGNKLDISEKETGFASSEAKEAKNRVIRKFYDDFQINGFLCHENVLSYGGDTRYRPEILLDLARFLKDDNIEKDWEQDNRNKHYIIKFKQPLNYYKYWTFEVEYEDSDYGITKDNLEYLPYEVIEAKVKKWLIQKSLYIIRYGVRELLSYVNPKLKIEPNDILEIMTEKEYLEKYNIEE